MDLVKWDWFSVYSVVIRDDLSLKYYKLDPHRHCLCWWCFAEYPGCTLYNGCSVVRRFWQMFRSLFFSGTCGSALGGPIPQLLLNSPSLDQQWAELWPVAKLSMCQDKCCIKRRRTGWFNISVTETVCLYGFEASAFPGHTAETAYTVPQFFSSIWTGDMPFSTP